MLLVANPKVVFAQRLTLPKADHLGKLSLADQNEENLAKTCQNFPFSSNLIVKNEHKKKGGGLPLGQFFHKSFEINIK